jgi:hypothetical protein
MRALGGLAKKEARILVHWKKSPAALFRTLASLAALRAPAKSVAFAACLFA